MSEEKNFSICNPTIVKEALEKNRTSNLYPTKDPDVIACEDEIGKMKKEGVLEKRKKTEPTISPHSLQVKRILNYASPSQLHKKKRNEGFIINAALIKHILEIHPTIKNFKTLSRIVIAPELTHVKQKNFNGKPGSFREINQLCKSMRPSSKTHWVSDNHIKKIATALDIKDWKTLIDFEETSKFIGPSLLEEKAMQYLSKIEKLEQEIKHKNEEWIKKPEVISEGVVKNYKHFSRLTSAEITDNDPVPEPKTKSIKWKLWLENLMIGQSVRLPLSKEESRQHSPTIRNLVSRYKKNNPPKNFAVRLIDNEEWTGVGIWRIENSNGEK